MNDTRQQVRRLSMLINQLDGLYDRISKNFGYKAHMLWLFYALDADEPQSQKQICERWLFRPTTLNTIVKECEAAGYVRLEPIPGKRRECYVVLTDAGREYTHQALSELYAVEEEAMLKMDSADDMLDDFQKYFDTLSSLVEKMITKDEKRGKKNG